MTRSGRELLCTFVLLAFGLLSVFASAQDFERLPAEELLRFYPKGDYEIVHHVEMGLIRNSEWFDAFMRHSRFRYQTKTRAPVPDSIWAEAESVTIARRVKILISLIGPYDRDGTNKSNTKFEQRRPGSSNVLSRRLGDYNCHAEGVGEDLIVIRFPDPVTWLKNALDKGEIAHSGEMLAGRAVYNLSHRNSYEFVRTLYLALFPTGEILAAEKPATLGRMAAAGRGEELNMLDDPKLHFFEEMLNVEGHYYWLETKRPFSLALIKYAENKGELDKEQLQKSKNYYDDPSKSLAMGEVWEVDTTLVQREIFAYRDKEYALARKAREESEAESRTIRGEKLAKILIDSGWRPGVVGNLYIEEMEYDEARIESIKALHQYYEEKSRERRRKEAEEKKEPGK